MGEDRSGRELTPREPGEVQAPDSPVTPVDGERRDVERFSAGPRAHSVGLTEERSAQIVRQSANARSIVFLAVLLIALFIPVYWFYESGIPALGTEGRMDAEAEVQYVTDVARGYELYLANCAACHGDAGQGGVGPKLNDQAKLYNVLTPAGDAGSGHLNPNYLDNVLTVGGRYVCGDPNSLMASWKQPNGPLNYRQVEELIAWITASQDVVFERHIESHGATDAEPAEPEVISGWRDPEWKPGPEDTPPPACWKAPGGLVPGDASAAGPGTAQPDTAEPGTAEPVTGGTPDAPRRIVIEANAALQLLGEDGAQLTSIEAVPGETIEFVVDNTAGFEHNFFIGSAEELSQPYGETGAGIPGWQSGEQTFVWTVPESGAEGLQFACTVPGHYTPMHGDIVITGGAPADGAAAGGGEATSGDASAAGPGTAQPDTAEPGTAEPVTGGTPDAPRRIVIEANAALQLLGEDGAQLTSIEAVPGETIEFVVDNTAGFEHNFFIGSAEELSQPYGETGAGIPGWQSGEQTFVWTVPESGAEGLQFACTVPGHYTPMHGDIVITS